MLTIRELTKLPPPHYIYALVDVFRAARQSHLQFSLNLHTAEEDYTFLSTQVLPHHQVWTAELNNTPIAFVSFTPGHVHHLYVSPNHQRKGLGTKLLTFAQLYNPTLQLWCFQPNTPALNFYHRHGFTPLQQTDGSSNESKTPDALLQWTNPDLPPEGT